METHIEREKSNTNPLIPSIILNALTIPARAKHINKIENHSKEKRLSRKGISKEQASVPKKKYIRYAEGKTINNLIDGRILIWKSSIMPRTKTGKEQNKRV